LDGEAGEKRIMIRRIYILILLIILSACANPQPRTKYIFEDHYHYGELYKELLLSHEAHPWFKKNYNTYMPDLNQLDKKDLNDITIRIFMGTWCHDSKREVPRFYKILNALQFDESRITMTGLKKNKKGYFKDYSKFGITNTPTIIIYRKNIEIGRIIERPDKSLESHFIKILEKAS